MDLQRPHDIRRQMIHDLTKKRHKLGLSPPLTEELWILNWLEAEELNLGQLNPGMDATVPGLFVFLEENIMNTISISARVISILKAEKDGKLIANCFVQERNGANYLTYKAAFWEEVAEYILKKVKKDDEMKLTGYIHHIENNIRGPYLELRNCKLENVTHWEKNVEDVKSLWEKKVENDGPVS